MSKMIDTNNELSLRKVIIV